MALGNIILSLGATSRKDF